MEPLKTVGSHYTPERKPKDDLHHLFVDTVVDLVGRAKFRDGWGSAGESQQWIEVVDWLADMAREGGLEGFVPFAGFSRIHPEEWAQIEVHKAFRMGKIWKFGGSRWLYFSVVSVQALLFREARPSKTSTTFTYDMQATRWSLFEAAVWVATGGMDTNTAAISEGNLEDAGCRTIVERLVTLNGLGVPEISGLAPPLEIRQSIPRMYLERTHTGWLGSGTGHLVRFYEASDPTNPEGPGRVVADFTPKGHLDPTLFDLSMLRDDVLALFPRSGEASNLSPSRQVGGTVETRKRPRKTPPRQPFRQAIEQWFQQVHGGMIWPDETDQKVADLVIEWAQQNRDFKGVDISAEQVRYVRGQLMAQD